MNIQHFDLRSFRKHEPSHHQRPRHRPLAGAGREARRPDRGWPHRPRRQEDQGRRRDVRRRRPGRHAGIHRPAHAPPRAGTGAQGDHCHRNACGRGRRLHRRLRDGQHHSAERRAGRHGDDHRRSGAERRLPRLSDRCGEQGPQGGGARRARRPPRCRLRGRERRRKAGLERAADAPRSRVRLDAGHAGGGARGRRAPQRGRRHARGLLLDAARSGRDSRGLRGDARGAAT